MTDTALALDVATLTADLLASCPPASSSAEVFLGAQFDAGLAFVHFPVGSGGLATRSLWPIPDCRPAA